MLKTLASIGADVAKTKPNVSNLILKRARNRRFGCGAPGNATRRREE